MRGMTSLGSSRLMMCGALKESVCRHCGKTFLHTDEHAYKGCCTYKCMRAGGYDQTSKGRKMDYEKKRQALLERIERCEKRVDYYRQLAENAKTDCRARSNANKLAHEWEDRVMDARFMLEIIEEKMHGKKQRHRK